MTDRHFTRSLLFLFSAVLLFITVLLWFEHQERMERIKHNCPQQSSPQPAPQVLT